MVKEKKKMLFTRTGDRRTRLRQFSVLGFLDGCDQVQCKGNFEICQPLFTLFSKLNTSSST